MGDTNADVVIVGAGPSGLMLAAELRLHGVEVVVLEQRDEPMQQSRALGFSARTIEEFDQRGLLERLGEVGTIPFGHFGGVPLDYGVIDGGSYGARGIPQSRTEAMLARRAVELGASVRRSYTVTAVDPDDEGVSVEAETPDGVTRLRARYVVGADGARSVVRRLTGIDFPGSEPTMEMWLADVAGCDLRLRFSGEAVPGGLVMVLPLGPNAQRVAVYQRDLPEGSRPESGPPTFEQVADAFQRLTGEDIHGGRPLWVSWFTDTSRIAAEFRRGRVFLVGDAAHVHMPIGGQGLSAGIQDAVNLGWKLAAEVQGRAATGLLDSYHAERHPVDSRVVMNTLAQRWLYLGGSDFDAVRTLFTELAAIPEVKEHLVGMVTGLDIRYDVGPGEHPLLGRRMPRLDLVATGDGEPEAGKTTTFQALESGRGVLFVLGDGAADPVATDLEQGGWAASVQVVRASVPTDEGAPGPLTGVDAVLVRPDGYVAWVAGPGAGTEGLDEALSRWFRPAS